MITRRGTLFIGIFIFLIPFMGLPTFWKTLLTTFSGLSLVFSSISINISAPKKPTRARTKKEKITTTHIESIPVYPKDNIIIEDINSYRENSKSNIIE